MTARIVPKTLVTMSSREIAKLTGKQHKNVLRDIDAKFDGSTLSHEISIDGNIVHVIRSRYKLRGKFYPKYHLCEDATNLLLMGYNTRLQALIYFEWKALKKKHTARLAAKTGWPEMTLAIDAAHDPVKFYHFANEANMINRLVTGMSAKQIRKKFGLDKDAPIRDHLTVDQLALIEKLQKINTSLIEIGMDYAERKERIEQMAQKRLK